MDALCERPNKGPSPKCPHSNPGTFKYVTLHDKRDFADVIKVENFEKERLAWIIQVVPMESDESVLNSGRQESNWLLRWGKGFMSQGM